MTRRTPTKLRQRQRISVAEFTEGVAFSRAVAEAVDEVAARIRAAAATA
jgi:hypothetical protein